MKYIFALLKFSEGRTFTIGIFSTQELAMAEFDKLSEEDECEYQVEEWPIDIIKTRHNTYVACNK